MPKESFEEAGKPAGNAGERGDITRAILFVLLLLTAVLGYLYFFTGLIKPREYVAKEPLPRVAPVKHPLPPRPDGDAANIDAAAEPVQAPPPKTAPVGAPVAAPAPPPRPQPAVAVTPPKPAAVTGKPTAKAEKPAARGASKGAPVSAAPLVKTGTAKSVTPAAAPAAKVKASPAVAGPKKSGQGAFSLLLGEFATDREAERARLKLGKLGISGVNSRKSMKVEAMHRLFLADFADREAAEAELLKLRPIAGGAFILKENGRYSLYAGSYLREKGASSESRRLAAKGIKVVPRTAAVTLPMCELTTGPFPDREKAQREADRLKKNGFAARVVEQGK